MHHRFSRPHTSLIKLQAAAADFLSRMKDIQDLAPVFAEESEEKLSAADMQQLTDLMDFEKKITEIVPVMDVLVSRYEKG